MQKFAAEREKLLTIRRITPLGASVYREKKPPSVISQGKISEPAPCHLITAYLPRTTQRNQIGMGLALLFALGPPAPQTN